VNTVSVIQIDFWQLIGMAGAIIIALSAAGWALLNIIVKQFTARLDDRFKGQDELRSQRERVLDERFKALEKAIKYEGDGWRKVERELLELKGLLPLEYMRREDSIRQEVVIHAKLDALAAKIDALRVGG
jgi:flagellar motility protein MotE (MotC chaperone)